MKTPLIALKDTQDGFDHVIHELFCWRHEPLLPPDIIPQVGARYVGALQVARGKGAGDFFSDHADSSSLDSSSRPASVSM
ncbi:unnamed protein product [Pararhodospirillum photometricum DSM 122]|uniref:Uncharacterized protein n=1 Tax=Pararhodospirillum photometricum DSM 122 TaxID=1150469 RepID=H6SM11_PARPM|nr:unnamed protein product [Pararhodospirillum photometricum DSM 122]